MSDLYRFNYIVEILTTTPRRLTTYAGLTSSGLRGLTVVGSVSGVTVTNGGSGYTSAPAVTFSGGGGTGAAAIAVLSGAAVASIVMTAPGSGYTSAPTVGFTGGGGSGAAGTASISAYYKSAIVEWPNIDEADTPAPLQIEISIGNAKNDYTDLFSNVANYRKPITIWKVEFTGATWNEAFAPTFTRKIWFEGITGRPRCQGERLILECHADLGRRGKSPKTASRKVMLYTQPVSQGTKIVILPRN
jgi:hypothetical protein